MADVFISYARSTESHARAIEKALAAEGFAVWRDDQIPAHRAYAEVIEERLRSARAVVVIWSADAAKSQWVRAEADAARELGTLIQVRVDETLPPLPFNQIQCAPIDIVDGRVSGSGWSKLKQSVDALAGLSPAAEAAPATRPTARKTSICVLPFVNMSGDSEQEYFSDGISEDITTDLSKVTTLAVTARNTAFTFKNQAFDVCDIASRLGVTHILEGSVRKAGERVRITAQLIDGTTGEHVWADRYDRDLTDIFAIQDEISKTIVAELRLKLLPEDKKAIEQRDTTSAEAYDLYLLARNYWVTGNHGDRRREERVIRICQRAIEIDATYARAWALLAIAQSNLRFGFGQRGDDGTDAAKRALSLNPTIAEAHCATARSLSEQGHNDEALSEIAIGLALDPASWEVNKTAGYLEMRAKDLPAAARHYERATEAMEGDYHAWGMLVTCYDALGDDRLKHAARMAHEQAEEVLAQDPSNGAAISFSVLALAALGEAQKARDAMHRALLIDPDNLNMRYNFGCCLAASLGDKDGAIAMLEPVMAKASGIGLYLVDPDLDSIRDDPRFIEIIDGAKRRLGID